jgi:hypothetical protein
VADGEKARRELGFVPRHRSKAALLDYLGYRYPKRYGRPRPRAAVEEASA